MEGIQASFRSGEHSGGVQTRIPHARRCLAFQDTESRRAKVSRTGHGSLLPAMAPKRRLVDPDPGGHRSGQRQCRPMGSVCCSELHTPAPTLSHRLKEYHHASNRHIQSRATQRRRDRNQRGPRQESHQHRRSRPDRNLFLHRPLPDMHGWQPSPDSGSIRPHRRTVEGGRTSRLTCGRVCRRGLDPDGLCGFRCPHLHTR